MTQVRDQMFIGGHLTAAHSTQRIPVVNPATEQHFADIIDGDAEDVDRAVSAAAEAHRSSGWAQSHPGERADALRRLADALEARLDELGPLVTSQNGTAITRSGIFNATAPAGYYRYFASLADDLQVESIRPTGRGHSIVRKEPVGVAALIVPWNGPQGAIAWKLGPALAAGCTAVLKPAPETSLDAYVFAEAVIEAGIPAGVVNIVTGGRETGATLVAHPGVRKVAFTGSTAAGRAVATACAAEFKRVTLELGGKSAAILLEDVDLDAFRPFVATACSPMTGQVCRALTRVLAPRSRYEEVVDAVASAMEEIPTGDPMDPATVFGPLVAQRQRDRVERYIKVGVEEGAKLVTGGGRPRGLDVGYYVEPTVFKDVSNDMRIAREEIFGPVLAVIPYDGEEDALRQANDSDYGLGGAVFTRDVEHGTDIARRMETGTVGVDHYDLPIEAPFGGVKCSGMGRELGPESLVPYLETKSIYRAGDVPQ
jgi:betaine-aldehyde dehydrogenase